MMKENIENYININRNAYNELCQEYMDRTYKRTDNRWTELFKKYLIDSSKVNKILEIGPGIGRILKILEDNFNCRTIAVDLSNNMIKAARKKSPNTCFIEDNILNVNFEEESFDVILLLAVLHNFPKKDAKKLLERVKKWLAPNGKILINTTLHKEPGEGYSTKDDYKNDIIRFRKRYTEQELNNLLDTVGLESYYTLYTQEEDRNKQWIDLFLKRVN